MEDENADSLVLEAHGRHSSEPEIDKDDLILRADKTETSRKRSIRNLQPKLNVERLKGPRGLVILEDWFKNFNFSGKRHEKEDLDAIMCLLEQWTHRLFPKFTFDDALNRIEKLGHKCQVSNYVKRIRVNDLDVDEENPNENILMGNVDTALINVDEPLEEEMNRIDDHFVLNEAQRERMVRNRLLAEERRMARMNRAVEK